MTYLLLNKQPHKPVDTHFMVYVNQKERVHSDSVRYLGVTVDDKLSLSEHLKELALILSRCYSFLLCI